MNTAFAIRVLGMWEKSHIGKGGEHGNCRKEDRSQDRTSHRQADALTSGPPGRMCDSPLKTASLKHKYPPNKTT